MKRFIVIVCVAVLLLSVNILFNNEVAFAESGNITHKLVLTVDDVTVVAVLTEGIIGYGEWKKIKEELTAFYSSEKETYVTRDVCVYHRVKKVLNDGADKNYIAATLKMAKNRNE